jgi:hypothetical protein
MSDNPDHMDLLTENQQLREILEEIRQRLILDISINDSNVPELIDIVLGYAEEEQ